MGIFYFFLWVEDIDVFCWYVCERNVYILIGEVFGLVYGWYFRLCFVKFEEELDLIVVFFMEIGFVD